MNEMMQKKIILTREQKERHAAQAVQKIQAFVNEANNIQSRRCEVMVALLTAHVQHAGARRSALGFGGTSKEDVDHCRLLAHYAVEEDAKEKFNDLKTLFAELGIQGPQPHLEWAAAQVGITLFDQPAPPADEPKLIQPATIQAVPELQ